MQGYEKLTAGNCSVWGNKKQEAVDDADAGCDEEAEGAADGDDRPIAFYLGWAVRRHGFAHQTDHDHSRQLKMEKKTPFYLQNTSGLTISLRLQSRGLLRTDKKMDIFRFCYLLNINISSKLRVHVWGSPVWHPYVQGRSIGRLQREAQILKRYTIIMKPDCD